MSSLFNHIFIPLAILLIFSGMLKLDPRKIIILSFFGILPDIDIFLFHRASFHNILIPIIFAIAFVLLKNRKDRRETLSIISFYLISHIILDIFNGGTYLLYPFYNNVIYARADILYDYKGVTSIVDYGVSDEIVDMIKKESIMSSESAATMILLIIPSFLFAIREKKRKFLNLLVILTIAFMFLFTISSGDLPPEKPVPIPSVSIGCDRILWDDTKLEIKPSISNIKNATFQWFIDDKFITKNQTLTQKLKLGNYKLSLNTSFDNKSIEKNISVLVVNSIDGISIYDNQSSNNEWRFQTLYNGKEVNVQGLIIYVDSLPKKLVNWCGYVTIPLSAGNHTWNAEYNGKIIALGNFSIKEIEEIKIDKIGIKSRYKLGDTISGSITLKNTGTTIVREFDIKTIIINTKYSWMGNTAKREFYDKYNGSLNPGEKYDIPINVKIPEQISGMSPTGQYSITVQLILRNNVTDNKNVIIDIS